MVNVVLDDEASMSELGLLKDDDPGIRFDSARGSFSMETADKISVKAKIARVMDKPYEGQYMAFRKEVDAKDQETIIIVGPDGVLNVFYSRPEMFQAGSTSQYKERVLAVQLGLKFDDDGNLVEMRKRTMHKDNLGKLGTLTKEGLYNKIDLWNEDEQGGRLQVHEEVNRDFDTWNRQKLGEFFVDQLAINELSPATVDDNYYDVVQCVIKNKENDLLADPFTKSLLAFENTARTLSEQYGKFHKDFARRMQIFLEKRTQELISFELFSPFSKSETSKLRKLKV